MNMKRRKATAGTSKVGHANKPIRLGLGPPNWHGSANFRNGQPVSKAATKPDNETDRELSISSGTGLFVTPEPRTAKEIKHRQR